MSNVSVREAVIKITGLYHAGAAINKAMRDIDKATGKIEVLQSKLRGLSNSFAVQGTLLTAGITAPTVRAVNKISEVMGTYESAQARLASTLNVNKDALGAFEKQAQKLALSTPFTEAQTIGAQVELAMAGFNQSEILKAVPEVLNFAVAAQLEIPRASELASDVLRGLGKDVDFLPELMDKVAFAATKANQTSEQFMQSLVRFSPIARQMGMDVDMAIAMISNLADSGFKAAEGGNALRTIMLRLSAPTKAAREQLAALGIDLSKFNKNQLGAEGFIRGLSEAGVASRQELERFRSDINAILDSDPAEGMTRGGMIAELLTQAFGVDGATRETITSSINDTLNASAAGVDVQSLLEEINRKIAEKGVDPLPIMKNLFGVMRSAQGGALLADIDTIRDRMAELEAGFAGMAGKAAANQMETIENLKQVRKSAAEVMQRNLWERGGLGEMYIAITKAMTNFSMAVATLPDPLLKTAVNIGKMTAAIGPALLGVAAMTRVATFALSPVVALGRGFLFASGAAMKLLRVRTLLSPLTLVAAGVGALGFKLVSVFGEDSKVAARVGLLGDQFSRLWDAIKVGDGELAGATFAAMTANVSGLADELGRVAKAWAESVGLGKFMQGVQAWSAKAADAVGRLRDNLTELNIPVIGSLGDAGDLMKWAAGYAAIRVAVNRLAASSLGRVVGMLAALPSALRAGAGMSGLMHGAMVALSGVMGRLGRFVFSPKSMGIVALTEAAFALRNAWADIGGDIGKEWQAMMDSFAVADFSGMTTALGNIGKIAWPSIRDSLLQPEMLAFMGTAMAWNVAGSLMKRGPWVLAGRAAGALFSMSFKGVSAIVGLGGAVASKIGSSVALGMSTKVGAMGLKVMKILGKGLLRAIPFVGWGLLAYEVGKMIWEYLPAGMHLKIEAVGKWFSEQLQGALKIGKDTSDKISAGWKTVSDGLVTIYQDPWGALQDWYTSTLGVTSQTVAGIKASFVSVGKALVDAIKEPFVGFMAWFAEKLDALIAPANKLRGLFGMELLPENLFSDMITGGADQKTVQKAIAPLRTSEGSSSVEAGDIATQAAAEAIMAIARAGRAVPDFDGYAPLPLDGLDLGLGFELGGNGLAGKVNALLDDKGSEMNATLRTSSTDVSMVIASNQSVEKEIRGLRADMQAGLIVSKLEGEADVRVKIDTPAGTSARATGMSSGNIGTSLDTGRGQFAP